ncbi:hypothetical protein HDV63DRAFT_367775 [Trichoderma sp. SZMC 28014]
MDEERRNKIAAALRQYRETVLEHNLGLLHFIVDGIERLRRSPSMEPRSRADITHLQAFNYFGFGRFSFPESLQDLRDLFNDDVRAELVKRNSLDGVCDIPINSTKREEWFSKIKANMAAKNIDLDTPIPLDLIEICGLVDGITGPGLPSYTQSNQIEFLSPSMELKGLDYLIIPTWDDTGEREDVLLGVWQDWEIAVAFQIGKSEFALAGTCAIYCRHTEDDDNKEWKWRYGIFDEDWHSDMYNSVEEFLVFYAHHKEQTVEWLKKRYPRLSSERAEPR